ncbi:amidohydrolase family-domain-containing protein [Aspergillus unguis]
MDTEDRVLCHACGRVWPRNQYEGLECPHCNSDFTEIVSILSHFLNTVITFKVEIPPDTEPEPEPSSSPPLHPDPPESFPGHRSPSPFSANPFAGHNPWARPDNEDVHGWRGPGHSYQRLFQTPGGSIHYSFRTQTGPQRGPRGMGMGIGHDPHDPMDAFQSFDPHTQTMFWINRDRGARTNGPSSPGRSPRHPFDDLYGAGSRATSYHQSPRGGLFPRDADGPQPMDSPLRGLGDILEMFQTNLGNLQASQAGRAGRAGPGPGADAGGPDRPHAVAAGIPIGALLQLVMSISRNGDAVYSQEELDRVVSQLVEQNGTRSSVPPASQDAIQNLSKKPADAEMLGGEGGSECSICMDVVKIGDEVTVLPCTHWFHPQCIEMWLSQHNTCPHCRRGIEPTTAPSENTSERNQRSSSQSRSSGHLSFVPDEEQASQSRRRTSRGEGSGSGGWTGWVNWQSDYGIRVTPIDLLHLLQHSNTSSIYPAMKTLFHNAIVFSPTDAKATCLVIEDDQITYTGSEQGAPVCEKQIDVARRRILPGFIDGHMHLLLFGSSLSKISIDACTSLADIQSTIRSAALERPPDQYPRLFCSGWMHSMTNGEALASSLDDLDPHNRPIFIDSKDLHSAWCNSAALADMDITKDTTDPEGGEISRDENGNPSGLLSEAAAVTIVWPHTARVATRDEKMGYIRDAIKAYSTAGYTGMVEMATDVNIFETVLALRESEPVSISVRPAMHWLISPAKEEQKVLDQVDHAIALHKIYNKSTSPDFRIAGIKVICDGVVDACTAALIEPYSVNLSSPQPLWGAEILKKVVQRADAAGLQCALHAIGDAAVRLAIDTLETVKPAEGSPSRRHRIEHLEMTSPSDAERLAALGITASIQPVHADPATLRAWPKLLGPERVKRAFAYREFHDAGANLAIGTDAPTALHFPMENLYTATTRRSAREPGYEERVNPECGLSLAQAITAATKGSAYSCFADDVTGSLEVGKRADFVIVEMDWDDGGGLLDARVCETYFGGRRVFATS